jgi:hypothetical protein
MNSGKIAGIKPYYGNAVEYFPFLYRQLFVDRVEHSLKKFPQSFRFASRHFY